MSGLGDKCVPTAPRTQVCTPWMENTSSLHSQRAQKMGPVLILPILQARKLRHHESGDLPQSRPPGKWWSLGLCPAWPCAASPLGPVPRRSPASISEQEQKSTQPPGASLSFSEPPSPVREGGCLKSFQTKGHSWPHKSSHPRQEGFHSLTPAPTSSPPQL